MDRSTLFQLLEEEFSDRESAIAKYGGDCLRVRDPIGIEHQLELRAYQKPIYRDMSWDVNSTSLDIINIPVETWFKYIPPDGSTLLQRFGLNNSRGLLDREQIRERLGLLPRAEFLSRVQIGQYRGIGRTTEMILDILVDLQTKDLVLIDSCSSMETLRIVRLVRRYARAIGIDHRDVDIFTSMDRLRGRDPESYQLYCDHSSDLDSNRRFQRGFGYGSWQDEVRHRIDRHSSQNEQFVRGYSSQIWMDDDNHEFLVTSINRATEHARELLSDTGNLKSSETPAVCQGCKNYNGSRYGGNLLICGMYPYGCDADICPDWEGKTIILIDLLSIEQNRNYLKNNERICVGKIITIEWLGALPGYLQDGNNISIRFQVFTSTHLQTTFVLNDPNLFDRLRAASLQQMRSYDIENHYQTIELAFPQAKYSFHYEEIECSCGSMFEYRNHKYCPSCQREINVDTESIEDAIVRRDRKRLAN